MRTIFLACCACIACVACEKDVTVSLPPREEQMVIEGTIETNEYPEVILTRSLNYFNRVSVDQLQNAFVHNADITVSDGTNTMRLKEFYKDTTNRVRWYYYTADSTQADIFKGKRGQRYTLRIAVEGNTYEATTNIPGQAMVIDSLWSERNSKDPQLIKLNARVTDPAQRGNYVRYKTARNGGIFRPGVNSTLDDQIVNGTTFNVMLEAGHDRTQNINYDTYGYFKPGDSVKVWFSDIDKQTYDFWRTLDFAYATNGNVFSSPLQVRGNIPGALGYWGGYAVANKSVRLIK
jgi:translation initiation factor IF-1